MFSQPFFIPSVLIALFAIPLIFGWISRQSFYGVRTAKTLSSDEAWYPVNRLAGMLMVISSAVYLIVAESMPSTTTVTDTGLAIWIIHLCAFVLPLIISLMIVRLYLRQL